MKEARPRLLREFIRAALYHPRHGYFTRQAGSVGSLDQPLDYKFILGESGYRAKLAEAYRTLGTAWLTPSEVFRPYFGQVRRCPAAQCMRVDGCGCDTIPRCDPRHAGCREVRPGRARQAADGRSVADR